jgi:hypothetical protein
MHKVYTSNGVFFFLIYRNRFSFFPFSCIFLFIDTYSLDPRWHIRFCIYFYTKRIKAKNFSKIRAAILLG